MLLLLSDVHRLGGIHPKRTGGQLGKYNVPLRKKDAEQIKKSGGSGF